MDPTTRAERGFTLIELSIVLVIIGLIVGGVLVGQDLIRAATVRAQVTQIEKFNQAANTFFGKFGYLPGDITPLAITQTGLSVSTARAGTAGSGDGNGELDGSSGNSVYAWNQAGETVFFWEDLASTNLIENAFTPATGANGAADCTSNATCSQFLPYSKIGNGSFVYVYSGYAAGCCPHGSHLGPNFFGISIINSIAGGNVSAGAIPTAPGLTVSQAYAIDKKVDDGYPQTGNVLAQFLGAPLAPTAGQIGWAATGATPSSSTCFDTSSGTAAYSTNYQGGSNVTCGISLKMQAGN